MADPAPAILIVDDDETNRYTLARRLRRQGYENLTEAADGAAALALLRTRPFDLVLLDVMMPGMDGYEVLQTLKSDTALRDIPVVMISALDAVDSVVRCIELGAEDYLPKPFNPVLLRARVGASLDKKRLRDQEAAHLGQIERERERSDQLLRAILPPGAISELKATDEVKPRRYEDVAVLFCDIVGFTAYCDRNPPEQVVAELQALVETFEQIVARHGLEKIKTIGDALLATAGLLQQVEDPLLAGIRCGLDLVATARQAKPGWGVRVGIHHGPVVAGVIGKRQFLFDLWGDTVNTAARVTACAGVNAVFISEPLWSGIRDRCRARSQGFFELKGKGRLELVECDGVD
ncbi:MULTISPECIES: adenylate/guanylate cyclase domain-containing protein [Inquilinus]|uniref:Class 3 adenylate cyclase n=1 Tax=Inquilinus ginsengisoli TaxID=363840 RepID=A0ABU1JKC5_9PROT|nr:adenylate/guanylate cyclase domain-containing protein [Inquilinus ginsengisoli]MDR6288019.1 class 3 adenylate cyclase [Inquilinus ginsengisoli]